MSAAAGAATRRRTDDAAGAAAQRPFKIHEPNAAGDLAAAKPLPNYIQRVALITAAADLTAAQVAVLLAVNHLSNARTGICYASLARLASQCKLSESTVRRTLRGLARDGYVVLRGERCDRSGRSTTNAVAICWSRLDGSDLDDLPLFAAVSAVDAVAPSELSGKPDRNAGGGNTCTNAQGGVTMTGGGCHHDRGEGVTMTGGGCHHDTLTPLFQVLFQVHTPDQEKTKSVSEPNSRGAAADDVADSPEHLVAEFHRRLRPDIEPPAATAAELAAAARVRAAAATPADADRVLPRVVEEVRRQFPTLRTFCGAERYFAARLAAIDQQRQRRETVVAEQAARGTEAAEAAERARGEAELVERYRAAFRGLPPPERDQRLRAVGGGRTVSVAPAAFVERLAILAYARELG